MAYISTQTTLFCLWLSGLFTDGSSSRSRLHHALSTVIKNERAIEMVEFAVMCAVVAVVALALAQLYQIIRNKFTDVGGFLNSFRF